MNFTICVNGSTVFRVLYSDNNNAIILNPTNESSGVTADRHVIF